MPNGLLRLFISVRMAVPQFQTHSHPERSALFIAYVIVVSVTPLRTGQTYTFRLFFFIFLLFLILRLAMNK